MSHSVALQAQLPPAPQDSGPQGVGTPGAAPATQPGSARTGLTGRAAPWAWGVAPSGRLGLWDCCCGLGALTSSVGWVRAAGRRGSLSAAEDTGIWEMPGVGAAPVGVPGAVPRGFPPLRWRLRGGWRVLELGVRSGRAGPAGWRLLLGPRGAGRSWGGCSGARGDGVVSLSLSCRS